MMVDHEVPVDGDPRGIHRGKSPPPNPAMPQAITPLSVGILAASIVVTSVHVAFLATSVVVNGALAAYAWGQSEPGARTFSWLVAAFGAYSGFYLLGLLTPDPLWRLVFGNLQWMAVAVVPVVWLAFTATYTGHDELLARRTLAVLSVPPIVTMVLTWSNPLHGLVWERNVVVVVNGLAMLDQQFGPWFWLFLAFGYGLMLTGTALVLRLVWVSDRLYATQSAMLAVGALVPVAANVLTIMSVTPIQNPRLDLTPYSFLVSGVAFGYALFRGRLLDLVPATRRLGRDAAVAQLEDGVVVVDTDRRVVYCNDAAASVLGVEASEALDREITELVDEPSLDFGAEDAIAEIEREDATYEVRGSPIRDRSGTVIGHTLVIYDVTARKRRARRLDRQREELSALNELNSVIRGVNGALVSATTRAEIEESVCDRLVDSEFYDRAYLGDVSTWRGGDDRWTTAGVPDEVIPESDPPGVVTREEVAEDDGVEDVVAVEGEDDVVAVQGDRSGDSDRASVVRAADGSGCWSVVPVFEGRTVYGALALYTDRETVSDREATVLAELGEQIGHAMDAVENRQLLSADAIVELELSSTDEGSVLYSLGTAVDGEIAVSGLVPAAEDHHLAYLEVDDESADGEALDGIFEAEGQSYRAVDEEGSTVYEWVVTDEVLLGHLMDGPGNVASASVDGDSATYTVELPSEEEVRRVVDGVKSAFPDTDLVSKREQERPGDLGRELPGETIEDLTDRQSEVLEAAYRSGYFEWPRGSTAEEVAEEFDITAPTFHAHLRKAERGVMENLFTSERD